MCCSLILGTGNICIVSRDTWVKARSIREVGLGLLILGLGIELGLF